CQPPCQNRGSCSRPHTCVCRSGFQGPRCEEVAPEQVYVRTKGAIRKADVPEVVQKCERRMSCIYLLLSAPSNPININKNVAPINIHSTQIRPGHAESSSHQTGTSRTVKRYPSPNGQITSNALPNGNGQLHVSQQPASTPQSFNSAVDPKGANLTANIDRIKIVFTPMICKRVCRSGQCFNSCEKGDTTTIYSENTQSQVSKSGFRMYFCQIPCMSGGHCIGRDQCWCPSNSTGKFCHLPAPPPGKHSTARKESGHSGRNSSHTMYTLPLSNQLASMHPSLVNVHIQHPPEAEVQIHQVARVKPDQVSPGSEQNSINGWQSVRSVQQRSQAGDGHGSSRQHGSTSGNGDVHSRLHNRLNGHVGRCFQETIDGQCGKPLPGLTKQDDCCGSVGASWGLNKCTACPPKPAYAVIANGKVECPKGYKKMNQTHCQDINECLMSGICRNAMCLNTRGSYRCTCAPGYMLDTSRSHCISDKAVSVTPGMCYRSVSGGTCSLPLSQHITKQICCCSRVGRAWGQGCERCPLPDTADHFKEICPAGHGYTYSLSDIQISLRQAEEEELAQTSHTQHEHHRTSDAQQTVRVPTANVNILKFTSPHPPQFSEKLPAVTEAPPKFPGASQWFSRPPRSQSMQSNTSSHIIPTVNAISDIVVTSEPQKETEDIDRCSATPNVCGPGVCVPVQGGYTCYCSNGFHLNTLQTRCVADIDECKRDPCEGKGHCVNSVGSYTCYCYTGYSQVITQNRRSCQDVNECDMPNKCPGSVCINTEGSFTCKCENGYTMSRRGQCEDIDECRNPSTCPSGRCINTPGSFQCLSCDAGYRAQSGRCIDVDECLLPGVCSHGNCVNLEGSYRCSCNLGYQESPDSKSCEDVDECSLANVCPGRLCKNTQGSFYCRSCEEGYELSEDGYGCEDVDECLSPGACPTGVCSNTEGSYTCTTCDGGYKLSADKGSCEDQNECDDADSCVGGDCINTPGSYSCSCPHGYELIDGSTCRDVNECLSPDICGLSGECLNAEGSFFCLCSPGYTIVGDGMGCQAPDVDECSEGTMCSRGQCLNTDGSFQCVCETGYKFSHEAGDCEDMDECKEYGTGICGTWRCENTLGSYRCFMGCASGVYGEDARDCEDIDECTNKTICGKHGICENMDGSYRCLCDQGYTSPPGNPECVDINECEMSTALCGTAFCENVEGTFLCLCPNENEEFNPLTSQCHNPLLTVHFTEIHLGVPIFPTDEKERKECYYNLEDDNFCDNVLSRNTTMQECCCTVGAGWGDNCEIYPCPPAGRVEYDELCPHGKGVLSVDSPSLGLAQQLFKAFPDADECEMFGSEICTDGSCVNIYSGYSCYCRMGYYYDTIRLACLDHNECEVEDTCVDGTCVNTPGSFNCFCSPPLLLDSTRRRCIAANFTDEDHLNPDERIHMEICWQRLTENSMCSNPLLNKRTTYTECCCLYGVAWGDQCAFCPSRLSAHYATLCNKPQRGLEGADGHRERPGYEYGPDSPVYGPGYGDIAGGQYYHNLGPEYGPQDPHTGIIFPGQDPTDDYGSRERARVPVLRPREFAPRLVDPYRDRYDGFEGLRAEECGILNGCENGRCVRVREGYTCDCFDGFELDLAKMACIDINECEDISDKVPLCQNGACVNTEGSYKCTCLSGFVASSQPHQCIPEA
uniref:Latent-transforming growth factor beta-binding protein 1 n=1 Tax=Lepisosteus oculatus TaxID=7918 RepID=W5MXR7_LEPOC